MTTTIKIKVSERDVEILKEEAAKAQYDFDEYLEKIFHETMRPFYAKRAKAEMEENKRKWGYR